jgi:hypothetical protein
MPAKIREWLVGVIGLWPDAASALAGLPTAFPEGEVHRLAHGGPFGQLLDGRMDEIDGRIALEVLENSRMAGEEYFRIWDDGTIERLDPAPRLEYSFGPEDTAAEIEAIKAAYFAHNRAAYDLLAERGFR